MTVKSDESLRQDEPKLTFETFLAAFDCIPMMLSIFTAYEESHVGARQIIKERRTQIRPHPFQTSPTFPFDAAINSAINYIPLRKPLGSADYTPLCMSTPNP